MTDAEMTSPPSPDTTIPVDATPEPEKPKSPIVEPADRLRAENIQLRAEKLGLELSNLNLQVRDCMQRKINIEKDMAKCRQDMIQKYGIDLASVQINDDGSVSPVQMPAMPPGMGMQPGMRRPMPVPFPAAVSPLKA